MNDPFKYRAFISYSHSDEKWARWLHRSLETYRMPKNLVGTTTEFGPVPERFAPVFRDRDELATATNLGATLITSLEQSACQIVICSPNAARSRWVNEEILAFKRLGQGTHLLPDCRRGAGRLRESSTHGSRVLSECADLSAGRGREPHLGAGRTDRGGRAAAEGP